MYMSMFIRMNIKWPFFIRHCFLCLVLFLFSCFVCLLLFLSKENVSHICVNTSVSTMHQFRHAINILMLIDHSLITIFSIIFFHNIGIRMEKISWKFGVHIFCRFWNIEQNVKLDDKFCKWLRQSWQKVLGTPYAFLMQ